MIYMLIDNYLYSHSILKVMDKFVMDLEEAKKHLLISDHILTMTYPLVNDPKLLLSVIENLNLSFQAGISAVLEYERELKLIPPYHDSPEGRLDVFKQKIIEKYEIPNEYVKMIEDIKSIVEEHKESPVEFSKKDEFVICSDEFKRLKTINVKEMKEYVSKAKIFISSISSIVGKK